MRSAARKSATPSPTSAEITPTSVTRGKSCPLAIICVPTSTSSSPAAKRDSSEASAPFRRTESRSTLPMRAAGNRSRRCCFDLLGAEAGVLEIRRRALPAGLRHRHRVVAVVAARPPALDARGVHGQRDAAVRALEGVAALAAEDRRRIAAAIQQHQHLLASLQPLARSLTQARATDHDVGTLRPHIPRAC